MTRAVDKTTMNMCESYVRNKTLSKVSGASSCNFYFFSRQKADKPTPSFCQVERRFHSREVNRQPLPLDLGISPPSSSSLRSCLGPWSEFLCTCVRAAG